MINKKLISQRKVRKIKCELATAISDELYIKFMYKKVFGKFPDLKNPKTFNEKQNWLKLHNRKEEYTVMADKYLAKQYIANKIGEEYVIPLLGVWDSYEDIDFDKLPDSFILKSNNGSGDLLICKNKEEKEKINHKLWKQLFDINLSTKYYILSREWPYKNIKPKIIAEKYMTNDKNSNELSDYKFFCFNGEPKLMFIATERNTDCKFDYYDIDFNHLDIYNAHPCSSKIINKPTNFDKMIKFAKILSKNIPFIRVDFYEIDNKLYFGEHTFYHFGGFSVFEPENWDYKLGDWIILPEKYNG